MKFSIAVNMERSTPEKEPARSSGRCVELVQLAEQGGFEIAWAAEHHTIELMAGPNPFTFLMDWAAHTSRIRLGTAVVVAPDWHPIRVAGEAALVDLLSDGRLELGLGRGAFQYEFDRMAGGMDQREGGRYLREMLPVLRGLWQGDIEHHGDIWRFPHATSVPKPLQAPHPPIWVAARDPDTFAWAMPSGANIMATPLSRPHSEVDTLGQRFADTLATFPGMQRPRFLMLRRTCVYPREDDWVVPVRVDRARPAIEESVPEYRDGKQRVSGTRGLGSDREPRCLRAGDDPRPHALRHTGAGDRQAEAVSGRRRRSVLLRGVLRHAARRRDALPRTIHHRGDAAFRLAAGRSEPMKTWRQTVADPTLRS